MARAAGKTSPPLPVDEWAALVVRLDSATAPDPSATTKTTDTASTKTRIEEEDAIVDMLYNQFVLALNS